MFFLASLPAASAAPGPGLAAIQLGIGHVLHHSSLYFGIPRLYLAEGRPFGRPRRGARGLPRPHWQPDGGDRSTCPGPKLNRPGLAKAAAVTVSSPWHSSASCPLRNDQNLCVIEIGICVVLSTTTYNGTSADFASACRISFPRHCFAEDPAPDSQPAPSSDDLRPSSSDDDPVPANDAQLLSCIPLLTAFTMEFQGDATSFLRPERGLHTYTSTGLPLYPTVKVCKTMRSLSILDSIRII